MALGSLGTNPYTQLQSALESARQRTAVVQEQPKVETASVRKPQSSGGSLFQKFYGQNVDQPKTAPAPVGSRFDTYA